MKTITLGNAALIRVDTIAQDLTGKKLTVTQLDTQRFINAMVLEDLSLEEVILNWAAELEPA